MNSAFLEHMFNEELFILVWASVTLAMAILMASRMYRTPGMPATGFRNAKSSDANAQTQWLSAALAVWWGLDALWHSRAIVIAPRFWRPEIAQTLQSHLPWTTWTTQLWTHHPMLWDFSVLTIDSALAISLLLAFRRLPPVILWAAALWGVLRWGLAGAESAWGQVHPVGPGAYLLAGLFAYCILAPHHYRAIMVGLTAWLAVDAILSMTPGEVPGHIALALGMACMGLAALQHWTPTSFRLLAGSLAAEALALGIGRHVFSGVLNQCWPALFVVFAIGLHWGASEGSAHSHAR